MKNEVLTPDVIEELPLEQVIEKTLVKNNVTNKVIAELKKKYGGMQLKSLTDKQGFLEIKDARNAVRKVGILTEKLCKLGRDEANKIRTMWIDKEKEVLGKIAEVQDPLDAEIKKFEDEEARLQELEFQRQEEQFMKRQTTLLKMEAKYEGSSFSLGSVSYDIQNIKEADEEIWTDTILPKFQREFAKVEEEKALLEKQKKEEQEKLIAEQQELLRQQNELKQAQEEMRLQKEALEKQQNEANRLQQEEQNRRTQEALEKRNAITNARVEQLINLGLTYSPQYSAYVFKDVNIDVMTELKLWNEQEWNEAIEKITPVIEQRKKEAEEKLQKELVGKSRFEALKTIGLIKEETAIGLSELSEQEWEVLAEKYKGEVKAAQEAQWKHQQEIEAENKRKLQEEESAKASDKDKWATLINALSSIAMPEFKSSIYKGKVNQLVAKINEIKSL